MSHLLKLITLNYPVALADAFLNLAIYPWCCPRKYIRYILDRGRQRSLRLHDAVVPCRPLSDVFPLSGDDAADSFQLPPVWTGRLTSEITELFELAVLASALRATKPTRVFEFGTYRGTTTLFMAANLPDAAEIVTLDLPSDRVAHVVGEAFLGRPEARKIRQLHGDSRQIDLSSMHGQFDLIFVDGDHTREGVVADTVNAGKLLRPNGTVIWHDFQLGIYPRPIVDTVRECRELMKRRGEVYHIQGTTLAVFRAEG